MAITDIFKRKQKDSSESNTLFGQTALGNNVLRNAATTPNAAAYQLLYVTTSSTTTAGRTIDMSMLSRNSTVMACIGVKARALAQLPNKIMAYGETARWLTQQWIKVLAHATRQKPVPF